MSKNYFFATGAFLISFIVYVITLAPDVMFTDSGELAGVCVSLGIAHPTGYPLFTILGHIWSLLPMPFSEIYQLNLFAAFTTALGIFFFYFICYEILNYLNINQTNKNKKSHNLNATTLQIFAFASSLALAFGTTIWAQAASIEVYSLQFLLICLILFIFIKAFILNSSSWFIAGAFFTGLAFANHMTTLLLLPALAYLLISVPGGKFSFDRGRAKLLGFMAFAFIIGLSLYVYLPVRSAMDPIFDWGGVNRSFSKFWYHVSGKQYQVWMFTGSDTWSNNLGKFFATLPYEFAWAGLVLVLWGMWESFRRVQWLFRLSIILVLSCLLYSLNYSIHDIEAYFITAFAGFAMLLPVAFHALYRNREKLAYTALILPALAIVINFVSNDQSDNYLVPEYTGKVMQSLEPDAVIISAQWDYWCSAFWYKQQIEGRRTDVVLIEKELLRRTWYLNQLRRWYPETMAKCSGAVDTYLEELEKFESGLPYDNFRIQERFENLLNCFIEQNIDERPVYITLDVMTTEQHLARDYQKVPQGFAIRIMKQDSIMPVNPGEYDMSRFISSLKGNKGHLVEGIAQSAAFNFVNMGRYAMLTNRRDEAGQAIRKALEIDPQNSEALNAWYQLQR